MSKIGVATDSSSCMPAGLAARYGILIAPNHLIIGRKDYRDLTDISSADFWKMFRETDGQVTTAAVSPRDFVEVFRKLAETNESIVCFVISAKLSVTFQSALKAKELVMADFPNLKIEVVDSKSSIGGLSFVAVEAARAAQSGKNLAEVLAESQKMISQVKYLLVLQSAKYIMRIGRAPEAAKKAAEQSSASPIMGIVKGTGLVDSVGSGAGFIDGQRKVVDMIRQFVDPDKPMHVMLHYCEDKAEVKELETLINQKYHCEEIYFSQFSPVVLTAIGPAVAVSFYS